MTPRSDARSKAIEALAEALRPDPFAEMVADDVFDYLEANPEAKAALCVALMPEDGHLCCCLEGDDDDAHVRDRSLEQPFLRGRYSDDA